MNLVVEASDRRTAMPPIISPAPLGLPESCPITSTALVAVIDPRIAPLPPDESRHMLGLLLDLLIDKKAVKGWVGEKLTAANLWIHLDEKVYHRLHDIIIPTNNGTTQIDHVVLSVYGIFVVETKNFKGWIFGKPNESNWCQSLPGGKKNRFQNPLHQNYRHIQCLAEFLKLDPKVFHSVVFFIGECQFKTAMPPNVMSAGMCTYIRSFSAPVFSPVELGEIERKLTYTKLNSGLTKRDHLASLEQRHNSTTTCPKCGGQLVERTAKASGKTFMGCSNFPKCRLTVCS